MRNIAKPRSGAKKPLHASEHIPRSEIGDHRAVAAEGLKLQLLGKVFRYLRFRGKLVVRKRK
jgi:hypothetical protein